jgi:exodeoxyribonuclease V alpha subunit
VLVLQDIIASNLITTKRLTKVFRQQSESSIIDAAHRINAGQLPNICVLPNQHGKLVVGTALEQSAASDFRLLEIDDPQAAVCIQCAAD